MKKIIIAITFLGLFLPLTATQHVPLELNFSDPAERAKWQFANSPDTIATQWHIGQAPDYGYGDDYMLYISNDGGNSNKYDAIITSYYVCYAYYPLDVLPPGNYTLNFAFRGVGRPRVNVQVSSSTTPYAYSGYNNTSIVGKWWRWGSNSFTSDGVTPLYVCCSFYYNTKEIPTFLYGGGYAIDAIQIFPTDAPPACSQRVRSLQMTRSGNDAIISWAGNASEYQLEYFMNDTSLNTRTVVDNITTTSYTLHCEQVPEGAYSFRVRSICGRDTSGWSSINYQLVYDISKHCMDFLNFNDPDVKAQNGWFSNPWYYNGVIDEGFTSENSRHTIHHYPRDVDERTRDKLRTFPDGQPAAIRLGNWQTGSQAEAIVYTMKVTEEMSILKLRYALVMQLPGHYSYQQPHFTLEFLDSVGVLIDSCGYVDFTASADLDENEGWHTEHTDGQYDIIWKDWSMVGLSMRDYIGKTVQVRITTRDCSEGEHFGYAYFTMSCSDSRIQGIHCGVKPDHFTVEDGFFYRWYHKYDPKHKILSRERTYNLTDPMDTATYCVDMINMIDTSCYFTMEASSLAFIPHSAGGIQYRPADCKNYIQLVDSSCIQGVYWKPDGSKVVVRTIPGVDEFHWDLGPYGTYSDHSPLLRIPDTGDTLHVKLYTYMENHLCEDSLLFDYAVPATGVERTITTHYFCHGGSFPYKGQDYTEEIDFADTLTGSNGCDSISIVALRYFQMDTIVEYDTLCSGKTMEWYGQILSEGGEYFSAVPSMVFDCDSVYNVLYLHQQPYLNMALDYTQQHVCAGNGGTIDVPYIVTEGEIWTYDLLFSKQAQQQQGFIDRFAQPVAPMATKLTIAFADSLRPGVYDASLVFHNIFCDSLSLPFSFAVFYEPDSLINQRWNDFLSVRKTAYDFYGGFTNYQWYRNDEPIAGQTSSQLYLPEEGLDPGSAYSVELTRVSDGMRVRTCPYYPTEQPNTVTITVAPTMISSRNPSPLYVRTPQPAQIRLYGEYGTLKNTWSVQEGNNQLDAPSEQGIYLLHILTEDGEQTVRKIIVQ